MTPSAILRDAEEVAGRILGRRERDDAPDYGARFHLGPGVRAHLGEVVVDVVGTDSNSC